jgi:hypothetical protein
VEELLILAVVLGAIWLWIKLSKKDAERFTNEDIYTRDGVDPFAELNRIDNEAIQIFELAQVEEADLQLAPDANQILEEIAQNISDRQEEQRKRTAPARVEYLKRKLALIQAAKELQSFAQDNNLPE